MTKNLIFFFISVFSALLQRTSRLNCLSIVSKILGYYNRMRAIIIYQIFWPCAQSKTRIAKYFSDKYLTQVQTMNTEKAQQPGRLNKLIIIYTTNYLKITTRTRPKTFIWAVRLKPYLFILLKILKRTQGTGSRWGTYKMGSKRSKLDTY